MTIAMNAVTTFPLTLDTFELILLATLLALLVIATGPVAKRIWYGLGRER